MKKIIAFIIAMVLTLGLFVGCGGSSDTESTDNIGSDIGNVNIISKSDIAYVKDGEAVYKIVRPTEAKMDEALRGSYLYKQFKDKCGINVKQSDDSSDDGTDAYEIILGPTNRPESKQAIDYLKNSGAGRYKDYIICSIGKKIVINAFNSESLEEATKYFVANYLKTEGVKGGIEYIYKVKGDWKDCTINGVSVSKFRIIRPHFNYSYLSETEAKKLVDYIYQNTGFMLDYVHDEYNKEEAEYEIVIGDAARTGVEKVLNYDEYTIKISGKRVFLNGGTPHATAMAVSEFLKLLQKGSIAESDSLTGSYETAIAGYDRSTIYYPTWYDTFDDEGIDTTKWHIMNDPEFSREGQNGKWSAMTNDPNFVYQTGGKFYIQGSETDDAYYGGTIDNKRTMAFQYGYVEKSAIVPDGPGFWSLLWFCGTGDGTNVLGSPEIDLNECFGEGKVTAANCHAWPTSLGKSLGYEHTSLDGKSAYSHKRVECPDGKTFADDYHTYGFLWDQEYQAFFLDGEEWFRYQINTTEWDIDVFVNSWMYMQLSFSVGRLNNGLLCNDLTVEEWQNSSKFIVDWLYLYQFDDGIQGLKIKN